MNKISKAIMKEIGVEVNQNFKCRGDWYHFNDEGMLIINIIGKCTESAFSFNGFLKMTEECIIQKEQRKPKLNERYYYAKPSGIEFYDVEVWLDDKWDNVCFERGLVFFTKEEAIHKAKQILGMEN